jgi:hypothetical protein
MVVRFQLSRLCNIFDSWTMDWSLPTVYFLGFIYPLNMISSWINYNVVDDSVVQRFGKKMPGISSHFDHTSGRHMMGQQVLTLGLS